MVGVHLAVSAPTSGHVLATRARDRVDGRCGPDPLVHHAPSALGRRPAAVAHVRSEDIKAASWFARVHLAASVTDPGHRTPRRASGRVEAGPGVDLLRSM